MQVLIGSMFGIYTYIWLIFMVNVGEYTIHGSYGVLYILFRQFMKRALNAYIITTYDKGQFTYYPIAICLVHVVCVGCLSSFQGNLNSNSKHACCRVSMWSDGH